MFFFDIWYLIFLAPGILLAIWAQYKVQSAYSHASRIPSRSGVTGAEAARILLDRAGISNGRVEPTHGYLSDHYVPGKGLMRLSEGVYGSRSLAALGIAAHESGHAFQDAKRYPLLVLRNALVPLAGFGSNFAWIILIAGFIFQALSLILAGIIVFSFVVVFQLVNLPVEFDASRRARVALLETGLITLEEDQEVARVLNAAALTYVAATLTSVLTLLYFLFRSGLLGGNRN
jgi:Zn-dependent membrane protease YugP